MLEGKLGETLSQSATDKICKIASEVPATKATSDTGTNPEPKKRDGSIFVFKLKKYYHRHQRLSSRGLLATLTPTVPATCQQRNRKSVVSLAEKTLYHSHWDREATFFFMIVRTTVKFRGHGGSIFSHLSPQGKATRLLWNMILSKNSAESCLFLFGFAVSPSRSLWVTQVPKTQILPWAILFFFLQQAKRPY